MSHELKYEEELIVKYDKAMAQAEKVAEEYIKKDAEEKKYDRKKN